MNFNFSVGGMPFLLFLVFLVLKLCHQIDWSWWYVTMPLWLIPVLALGFIGVAIVMAGIAKLLD